MKSPKIPRGHLGSFASFFDQNTPLKLYLVPHILLFSKAKNGTDSPHAGLQYPFFVLEISQRCGTRYSFSNVNKQFRNKLLVLLYRLYCCLQNTTTQGMRNKININKFDHSAIAIELNFWCRVPNSTVFWQNSLLSKLSCLGPLAQCQPRGRPKKSQPKVRPVSLVCFEGVEVWWNIYSTDWADVSLALHYRALSPSLAASTSTNLRLPTVSTVSQHEKQTIDKEPDAKNRVVKRKTLSYFKRSFPC